MPIVKQVNWDEVSKFETIPEGRYPARIDKIEERVGKTGDRNPYWNIEFTITAEEALGRKAWGVFMLAPNALWKLRQLYEALGIECAGEQELNSDELIGQEAGLVIGTEEYQGKLRNKISAFFKL